MLNLDFSLSLGTGHKLPVWWAEGHFRYAKESAVTQQFFSLVCYCPTHRHRNMSWPNSTKSTLNVSWFNKIPSYFLGLGLFEHSLKILNPSQKKGKKVRNKNAWLSGARRDTKSHSETVRYAYKISRLKNAPPQFQFST